MWEHQQVAYDLNSPIATRIILQSLLLTYKSKSPSIIKLAEVAQKIESKLCISEIKVVWFGWPGN